MPGCSFISDGYLAITPKKKYANADMAMSQSVELVMVIIQGRAGVRARKVGTGNLKENHIIHKYNGIIHVDR